MNPSQRLSGVVGGRAADQSDSVRLGRSARSRTAVVGVLLLIVLSDTGCFRRWGNSAANGALDAVEARSQDILLPLGDTVSILLTRFIDDTLRPRAEATADSLLDDVERRVDRTADSLAQFVGGSLNDAVRRLVDNNVGALRDSLRRALGVWTGAVSRSAEANLIPLVGAAVDTALTHALDRLNAELQGPLKTTVLALVTEIADSVRLQAGRTLEEQQPLLQRIGLVGKLIAGGLLLAAIAGLVTVIISVRNSRRALKFLVAAAERGDAADLQRAVRKSAQEKRWLKRFVEDREILG